MTHAARIASIRANLWRALRLNDIDEYCRQLDELFLADYDLTELRRFVANKEALIARVYG